MDIVWTAQAEQDLETIVEFIARDNVRAALEMDLLLQNAAEGLAEFPRKGKPGRVPGTRELLAHEHYCLVYTVDADAIHILAVPHTSRQWPPLAGGRRDAAE